ncbi:MULTISPECIES: hypothetical protein [unclassified Mesorhizobium]|uniref:hypothetical protein n=1 Tax=unclassified Mesorhizobium TaxID=325217 RepID=UPI000FD70681|nr:MULTISPECIES: hypothetical protein [unclassified Mesorhizobium]TGT64080.1 hypothetical protein EN809_035070 [Mesorhizobium sp. M2E.F.Ca.ET.166.01.1.1]TGV97037.1 hypothetical protein EN797_035095 [Mesorhizobium sp. M2E.F.Ca.ET.154.01.1.1]
MTLYAKNAGVIASAKTLYVKQGGVWVPAKQGYARNGGVWPSFLALPATIAFQQFTAYTSATGSSTTLTFANVPLGPAGANRCILMIIPHVVGGGSSGLVTGVTLDGTPMKLHAQVNLALGGSGAGIALAALKKPTGTTGNVVVTMSGGAGFWRPNLATYNAQNIQSDDPLQTPLAESQATISVSSHTFSHSVKKDGVVIFGAQFYGNTTNRSMSGLSRDYNNVYGASWEHLGGASAIAADNAAFPVTVSGGTTAGWNTIMASFR